MGPYIIESKVKPITKDFAKEIGDKLKVDWNEIDLEQFRMGLEDEQEHSDIVGKDFETIGKIALAHFKDDKHYYTKLKKAGL